MQSSVLKATVCYAESVSWCHRDYTIPIAY